MPKSFLIKIILKILCSQIFFQKIKVTSLCCERVFQKLRIRKLFQKNENWTFLKCPKVKKSLESSNPKKHTFVVRTYDTINI